MKNLLLCIYLKVRRGTGDSLFTRPHPTSYKTPLNIVVVVVAVVVDIDLSTFTQDFHYTNEYANGLSSSSK